MTDLRYLMLFLAMSFVVEQQAQISYAEYDDLYFDGVDQPKINQKVMSTVEGDEQFVDESIVENNYRKYKAGDNYDPYDYEYTSRVRRFYDAAPGFSYYSDFYVDNFYYDPYYCGSSIYMNQSPSYWNNYGHRPYWDKYGNRGMNYWGPNRGWGGYGSQVFWSGSSYYTNQYNGWYSYNNPYGNPFCSPFNNPYSWNSWNNGSYNNWYGQSLFNQVASTPAAGNYLSARYNRGSNTDRTGSLHRNTQPQVRPAVYHNRMNMSGEQRGGSYSRSTNPKQGRSGYRSYSRDQQSNQNNRSISNGSSSRSSNNGYRRSESQRSYDSNSFQSSSSNQRGSNSNSYSRPSQSTRSSGNSSQQRSTSRSSNRSGRPR